MAQMVVNILKKFGSSLLKGLVASVIVGLGAFAANLPAAFPDLPPAIASWLLPGMTALVAALISALKRAVQYSPTKDVG